jgi:hypothetical protein
MAKNWSGVELPIPGMSRSMTYLGMFLALPFLLAQPGRQIAAKPSPERRGDLRAASQDRRRMNRPLPDTTAVRNSRGRSSPRKSPADCLSRPKRAIRKSPAARNGLEERLALQ